MALLDIKILHTAVEESGIPGSRMYTKGFFIFEEPGDTVIILKISRFLKMLPSNLF